MSGPKVINIEAVRRRQKRESLRNLRKLQFALSECARWQTPPQASVLIERLHALQQEEQWEPLSIESAQQLCFYEEEVQRLRQQRAAEHAANLRRAHRLQQAIAQMTALLQSQPASEERDDLIVLLTNADSTTQQTALNKALHFIEKIQRDDAVSRLRELAADLMETHSARSAPGIPQVPADILQLRLEKCWTLLSELSALEDSPDLQTLSEKAQRITLAPQEQQALLLDSLALELSAHLQDRRATLALHQDLELLLSDLEEVQSAAASEWEQRLTEALAQPFGLESGRQLAQEARLWIEQTLAEETRLEQRDAILCALAATGYEVREGMATAWVEQGRLVLRKPNEANYGIELSAPAQGSAVQTRVVALTRSPRDAQRDLEIEETWCGEFEKARSLLTNAGFEASLSQAHPAGSIPLKVAIVSNTTLNDQRRHQPQNLRQRKVRE